MSSVALQQIKICLSAQKKITINSRIVEVAVKVAEDT